MTQFRLHHGLENGVIPKELFAGYVKDALANLYDPGKLQVHPLADLLVAESVARETRGQGLRQILLEAIESLQPARRVAFGRPEWLGYRVMWLRHVEGLDQAEICRRLGLGRTSFYERYREAFEAVVSLLWERQQHERAAAGPAAGPMGATAEELARDEAARVASASGRRSVNLSSVLEGVRETISPLAKRYGLDLVVRAPGALPTTFADPAVLRQILLNVLTEAIDLAAGRVLELTVRADGAETLWRVRGLAGEKMADQDLERSTGFVVVRGLLQADAGRLWVEHDQAGEPVLCFTVPIAQPKTILVIDDNDDTLGLYQRYLQARGFTLRVARNGDEVRGHLAQGTPDLILLDVLMPQQDGWDILQRLKTMPETANVPVVICSVLSQPHLALSLGAAKVLQKPIDQAVLLQIVEELLAQEGTWG
jgi:CheY-like chemotaxis protein